MPKIRYKGEEYDVLAVEDLNWAEAHALEKVTGYTMGEIQTTKRGAAYSNLGVCWITMKRRHPEIRFTDLVETRIGDIEDVEEPVADEGEGEELPDPTGPRQDPPSPPPE
jgi:hypothetical protein